MILIPIYVLSVRKWARFMRKTFLFQFHSVEMFVMCYLNWWASVVFRLEHLQRAVKMIIELVGFSESVDASRGVCGGAGRAVCGGFLLGRIQMRLQRPGTDDDPPSAVDPSVPASLHTMHFPRHFRFSSRSIKCFASTYFANVIVVLFTLT